MARSAADVGLSLWSPRCRDPLLKQVSPTIVDLTGRGTAVDQRTVVYPTGAWASEDRDYDVAIAAPPQPCGTDMLAGRVAVVVGGEVVAKLPVKAVWTDDVTMSAADRRARRHFTGQVELADAIAAGLAAAMPATRQARKSTSAGPPGWRRRPATPARSNCCTRVVHVEDGRAGTVRLKSAVAVADTMTLDTRSMRTCAWTAADPPRRTSDGRVSAGSRLGERVGETILGVTIAYLFGLLLPKVLHAGPRVEPPRRRRHVRSRGAGDGRGSGCDGSGARENSARAPDEMPAN